MNEEQLFRPRDSSSMERNVRSEYHANLLSRGRVKRNICQISLCGDECIVSLNEDKDQPKGLKLDNKVVQGGIHKP